MKVVAFSSQKGGSGKTTLAGHIAVQAERCGAGPVAIVDTDPQGSLTDWWNERQSGEPAFLQARIDTLADDIARARKLGFQLVIVDTPPAITRTIEQVVALTDLVLIPTRPSPHDLRAVGSTIELIESMDKSLVFVVNGAKSRARITGEAAVVLSQHGTVAPVTIHNRTDFASSMIDGRTVMELPNADKSAEEIAQLWGYIDGRLSGNARSTMMSSGFNKLSGSGQRQQSASGEPANQEMRWSRAL